MEMDAYPGTLKYANLNNNAISSGLGVISMALILSVGPNCSVDRLLLNRKRLSFIVVTPSFLSIASYAQFA